MARIRTIKPEFFTSEDIVSMDPLARLLYIALWCEADKEGRLAWKPRTFKLRYLPADDCDVAKLADELVQAGLVVLYGNGLAYIPSFTTHQHVNPRESVSILPAPPGVSEAGPKKVGKNLRALVIERDGAACVRCGSTDRIELDHILPQSCGGPHVAENLRVLCKSCNAARPVAGQALEEDLKRDGYTLEILRKKFGIDASISEVDAQVGKEGKGKEGVIPPHPPSGGAESRKPDAGKPSEAFERFWTEWPHSNRKVAKAQCWEKWRRKGCEAMAESVIAAVKVAKASRDWTKSAGEFIPAPLVWLNQDRWEAAGNAPALGEFDRDTEPTWALNAGFADAFQAENAGCYAHNAAEFHDGHRITEAA